MDTCTRNLENFVDLDVCLHLIEELNTKLGDNVDDQKVRSETERLVEVFRKTIDKYQEQPELLEQHVPNLIERLTSHLGDIKDSPNKYHTTFKFLYQLIKVIGFKSIGRRFPHETTMLPLLVELLAREDPANKANWQARFVLIVWLSIVILAPFDLTKFDTDISEPIGQSTKMQDRIYQSLLRSLALHDSSQHVTAFCLARFFSRPDMLKDPKLLDDFIGLALEDLKNVKTSTTSSMDDVKLIGYLRTLAYLFKFMPRSELKRRAKPILDVLTSLDIEKINRELVNHLLIKLVQRVGMAMLAKRTAAWRYKRGARILGQQQQHDEVQQPATEQRATVADEQEDLEVEEAHSAEALEAILSMLFVAVQNAQTKIRWSAAKGIARLASRLSRERASEVIDIVMSNFFNAADSSEYAWHGGNLTLAEMSRQGLILEEKLPGVIEIVSQSIIYDKIKGSFAVGSHVREAACYVLWAMSRTYEDHLLEPHIPSISINLLCTMLFDRELQCRRAASATFQELAGRQGTFNSEGISILTHVDYQSVGVRQLAYIELANQVARFGRKYYEPFIRHLIDRKLGHWDIQIRRLASDSLAALMSHLEHDQAYEFLRNEVFGPLGRMCEQSADNNARHGAILGLAKVVKSLVALGYTFEVERESLVDLIGGLVLKCSKQLASKQQAPNFIEAIGQLIASSEVAQFQYNDQILDLWEKLIFQALDSDNGEIRSIGSEALLSMYRFFYAPNKGHKDRLLSKLNKSLQGANESSRCGALKAMGRLGMALGNTNAGLLQQTGGEIRVESDTPDIILMALTHYLGQPCKQAASSNVGIGSTSVTASAPPAAAAAATLAMAPNVFAHAMAEACEALVNFITTLDRGLLTSGVRHYLSLAFDLLLEKSQDYTFDKRGDIGVVVRRAAVKSLQDLTLFLLSIGMTSLLLEKQLLARILSRLLQQAVSYNNSAREQAGLAFYRVIVSTCTTDPPLPHEAIPHCKEILQLFEEAFANTAAPLHAEVLSPPDAGGHQMDAGVAFNWRDESTPIFVRLLARQEYTRDLWIGLMPAIGQPSDLCAKQFRDAFTNYMQALEAAGQLEERQQILDAFLATLEEPNLAGRLVVSGLIVADYLLTSGLLHDSSEQFQVRFARLCWQSRGQADPKRLVSVGQVLCSMLQFNGQVQLECLKYCLSLLACGYAKVRVFTAAALYTGLLTYQSELEENLISLSSSPASADNVQRGDLTTTAAAAAAAAAESTSGNVPPPAAGQAPNEAKDEKPKEVDLEQAMELLAQSNWSEPLEKVRPIRDQICSNLLIEL